MTCTRAAATVVAVVILATPLVVLPSASAQAAPPKLPAFDAAVLGGWGAVRHEDRRAYDSWDGVGVVALEVGHYWSDHLKTELQLQTSSEAFSYEPEPEPVSYLGVPGPVYRFAERYTRTSSLAAVVHYQFFHNAWFHPFLGVGASIDRDRVSRVRPEQSVPFGSTAGPPWVVLPRQAEPARVATLVRPVVVGGIKAYVASRAFLRSDASLALARDSSTLRWQFGAGFDF